MFPKYFLFTSLIVCCLLGSGCLKTNLKILDEGNWNEMLTGEWMVEFFAPWCPACQQLDPVWKEFSGWSDDLGIKVASVDVTVNPGLSGRFAITSLPTIFHVKDGVFRHYRGSKLKEALISFIDEKKWVEIEPISYWKSPQSFLMSGLSFFFKMSMLLRNIHNYLVDAGIPTWGSYAMFGLATIFLGTILGLIIVCIIDLFSSKRPPSYDKSRRQPGDGTIDDKDREPDFEGEDVIRDFAEPSAPSSDHEGKESAEGAADSDRETEDFEEIEAKAIGDASGDNTGESSQDEQGNREDESVRKRVKSKPEKQEECDRESKDN